jgi:hypothetical protein
MFFSYIRVWNYFFMHNAYKNKTPYIYKISVEISDIVYLGPTILFFLITRKNKSKIIWYDPFDNLILCLFFPQFCDVAKVLITHKKN